MAISYFQVWLPAVAGTMDGATKYNTRTLTYVRGETQGTGAVIYWTDDGTSAGARMQGADIVWCIPMIADRVEGGAWGLVGMYGPVIEPNGPGLPDLYFVRSESIGSGKWRTFLYNAGVDSDGNARTDGLGRTFYCFVIS